MILNSMLHAAKAMGKIETILQSVWGWLAGIGIFVADYFAGHSFIIFLVVASTFIDAAWGIAVSVHRGQFAKSELARLTFSKLFVYSSVIFIFIGIDKMVDTTLTASIIGAGIVLVECWSSCASMLILYPNFLFLRLLKKALTGEIASKLNMSEEAVKEMMDGDNE